LQHTLQHTAACYGTLQQRAERGERKGKPRQNPQDALRHPKFIRTLQHTLQHTATHYNTLQQHAERGERKGKPRQNPQDAVPHPKFIRCHDV